MAKRTNVEQLIETLGVMASNLRNDAARLITQAETIEDVRFRLESAAAKDKPDEEVVTLSALQGHSVVK